MARCRRRRGAASRGPTVVEAHPVDHRPVIDEAKEAWSLVAGLSACGDGADLDVAETQLTETLDRLAVLVESRGDAER
jgi:hypothetical protein